MPAALALALAIALLAAPSTAREETQVSILGAVDDDLRSTLETPFLVLDLTQSAMVRPRLPPPPLLPLRPRSSLREPSPYALSPARGTRGPNL